MHPLFVLAIVTLLAVIAFAIWNLMSVHRNQQTGGNAVEGIGGVADPMSGTTTDHIRSGAEIRASLDAANAARSMAVNYGPPGIMRFGSTRAGQTQR
jgi:hypothetical protein